MIMEEGYLMTDMEKLFLYELYERKDEKYQQLSAISMKNIEAFLPSQVWSECIKARQIWTLHSVA